MPRLKFISTVQGVNSIELHESIFSIGSDAHNSVCIEDGNISKFHVLLAKDADTYKIFDLHSASGTTVNGQRITATTLKEGDTVQIGYLKLAYEIAETAPVNKKKILDSPAAPILHTSPKLAPSAPVPAHQPTLDTIHQELPHPTDGLQRTQMLSLNDLSPKHEIASAAPVNEKKPLAPTALHTIAQPTPAAPATPFQPTDTLRPEPLQSHDQLQRTQMLSIDDLQSKPFHPNNTAATEVPPAHKADNTPATPAKYLPATPLTGPRKFGQPPGFQEKREKKFSFSRLFGK